MLQREQWLSWLKEGPSWPRDHPTSLIAPPCWLMEQLISKSDGRGELLLDLPFWKKVLQSRITSFSFINICFPDGRGVKRLISTEWCPHSVWFMTCTDSALTGPNSVLLLVWTRRLMRAWKNITTLLWPCASVCAGCRSNQRQVNYSCILRVGICAVAKSNKSAHRFLLFSFCDFPAFCFDCVVPKNIFFIVPPNLVCFLYLFSSSISLYLCTFIPWRNMLQEETCTLYRNHIDS